MAQYANGQPIAGYQGNLQQATGMPMGQPVQQVFQNPQQQVPPASTMQAMNQGWQPVQQPQPVYVSYAQTQPQPQTMTAEQLRQQVENLAEDKFKQRSRQVANDAVYAMKGVLNSMGFFGNDQQQMQQQQAQQQQSFWNTTTGDVVKVAGGGLLGIGALKAFNFFRGEGGGGYTPSSQELNLVGEAIKTLFGK